MGLESMIPSGFDTQDITARKHGGSRQSVAAYERGKGSHESMSARLLEMIDAAGSQGLTSAEIEQRTGMAKNKFSGRLTQLYTACAIRRDGEREGCAVWVKVEVPGGLF